MQRTISSTLSRNVLKQRRLLSSSRVSFALPAPTPTVSVLDSLVTQSERFKTYKPVTPGLRHLKRPISPHLYEGDPVRLLTVPKRKTGGRNSTGKIAVRHIGGGHKQRLRVIDFKRMEPGPQDVIRIEYDPGRSAHIALLKSRNLASKMPFSYILAPDGIRAGDVLQSYRSGIPAGMVPGWEDTKKLTKREQKLLAEKEKAKFAAMAAGDLSAAKDGLKDTSNPYLQQIGAAKAAKGKVDTNPASPQSVVPPQQATPAPRVSTETSLSLGILRTMTLKPGNVLPLRLIPSGTMIHNITLDPIGKAVLVRSAGSSGQVVAHDDKGKYTQVKLQSGEVRNILQDCCATIGKVSNGDWKNRSLGKAGRSRWLGIRPSVRGMAMNA